MKKGSRKLPLHVAIATKKQEAKKPEKQGEELLRDLMIKKGK